MNNYIDKLINEVLNSKDKESSDNPTHQKKTKEVDIDEIVDEKGEIMRSKKPSNFDTKFITQKNTTDDVAQTAYGSMGNSGTPRTSRRFWGEGKVLSKKQIMEIHLDDNLGANDTIFKNLSYDKALKYFMNTLKLDEKTAIEKMEQLGYNKDLPKNKVNLIEKKLIDLIVDHLLNKKDELKDILPPNKDESDDVK